MEEIKAGIVIDNWKAPIFRKELEKNGYEWKESLGGEDGMLNGTTILMVTTFAIPRLKKVIEKAMAKAKRSKMN